MTDKPLAPMSDRTDASPEIQAAFRDIQMAIAGHQCTDVIRAMIEAMSLLVGMAANDPDGAIKVVDSLHVMLHASVASNWEHARELRAQSQTHANPGSPRLQ